MLMLPGTSWVSCMAFVVCGCCSGVGGVVVERCSCMGGQVGWVLVCCWQALELCNLSVFHGCNCTTVTGLACSCRHSLGLHCQLSALGCGMGAGGMAGCKYY